LNLIEEFKYVLQNLPHREHSEGFERACILVFIDDFVVSNFKGFDCVPDFFSDFFSTGDVGMSVGWWHFCGTNDRKVSPDTFMAN